MKDQSENSVDPESYVSFLVWWLELTVTKHRWLCGYAIHPYIYICSITDIGNCLFINIASYIIDIYYHCMHNINNLFNYTYQYVCMRVCVRACACMCANLSLMRCLSTERNGVFKRLCWSNLIIRWSVSCVLWHIKPCGLFMPNLVYKQRHTHTHSYIYIYIYVYVCVCVCVCVCYIICNRIVCW